MACQPSARLDRQGRGEGGAERGERGRTGGKKERERLFLLLLLLMMMIMIDIWLQSGVISVVNRVSTIPHNTVRGSEHKRGNAGTRWPGIISALLLTGLGGEFIMAKQEKMRVPVVVDYFRERRANVFFSPCVYIYIHICVYMYVFGTND